MVAPSKLLTDVGRSKKTPLIIILALVILLQRRFAERARKAFNLRKLTPEQLKDATRQLYVEESDGSKSLLVPFRGRVERVSTQT